MRKELDVKIDDEGRDKGKTYRLREMSAAQAEEWATRALLAMGRSGVEIPDDVRGAGLAGVAVMGLQSIMRADFADVKPLLDEMMACVSFKPDPRNPGFTRELLEDDIEEVATRLKLRKEVFRLHVDFSQLGAILR